MGKFDKAGFKGRLRAGAVIAMLALVPATAQSARAEAETSAETGSGDEIVVSAQRREQSTMDVGINVTHITNERLAEERVSRIGDPALHQRGIRTFAALAGHCRRDELDRGHAPDGYCRRKRDLPDALRHRVGATAGPAGLPAGA